MKIYNFVLTNLKGHSLLFCFALFLCLINSLLGLVNPYMSGRVIGEVIQGGNYDLLKIFILIMISATFSSAILKYLFRIILEIISQAIFINLRKQLFTRIQNQSFYFFNTNKVGDLMARMTGDLDAIRHFFAYVIYNVFENLLIFSIAIVIMFSISWQLTSVLLLFIPIIALIARKQSKNIRPEFRKIRDQFSKLNSVCQENISGNRVVKAFCKEEYEIKKFNTENENYFKFNRDANKVWNKYLPMLEFCANSLQLVLFVVGGILVINEKLLIWHVVAINGYLWAISNPVRLFGWLINDIGRCITSIERVLSIMEIEIKIKNPKNAIVVSKLEGIVEFKNVSFTYNDNDLALKNISFKANKGEIIGILGSPGSGKSTLVNLISRFYDAKEGQILLDDVDIKKYDLQSIRKCIGFAMQDVFLFSDSIENNIAYGNKKIQSKTIKEIAKVTDSHLFIKNMEHGYETLVGERGVGLSGGQKQRLSLARALATNPSILILDDTTSSVDMETEYKIQKRLKEKFNNITTFIISNKISSVRHADLILILENGEIIEKGTHEQLLGEKKYYFDLFTKQYFNKKI